MGEADELEGRHVTPQMECARDGAGTVLIFRCLCGTEHRGLQISFDEEKNAPMPCCGARLFFRLEVMMFEIVDEGGTMTQPPAQHPIWSTEVAKVGQLVITLSNIRDSMLEAGGSFSIHGYSREGNPMVDATTPDGATLDELLQQQELDP